MKISVIVPTYKPKDYIWECLDSICAQKFDKHEYEVILVLNGCYEPYDTIIKDYICNHPEVQWNYIHTNQGGVSNARNIALDCARGDYVTFIDDDDFVSQTFLSELYEKAADNTISLCYPYAFNDGNMEQLTYRITSNYEMCSGKGIQPYSRARKYFSGPGMKLIPMSYIRDRRFDKRFKNGEDALFNFLISDKFEYVDFTSINAVYYRRYRSNSAVTTHRQLSEKIDNARRLIGSYISIYFSNPLEYSFIFFITRLLGTIRSLL